MATEIKGLDEIQKKLSQLDASLSPSGMKKKMLTIGNMTANVISESFEKEREPDGKKWKPLKIRTNHSSYQRRGKKTHTKRGKQTKGFTRFLLDKKILRSSGALATRWSVKATSSSVTIGTNVPYAAIQNFGGKAGRNKKVKIPARRFVPIDSAGNLDQKLSKRIDDYLGDEIEKIL